MLLTSPAGARGFARVGRAVAVSIVERLQPQERAMTQAEPRACWP